jgi:hypothetical protein
MVEEGKEVEIKEGIVVVAFIEGLGEEFSNVGLKEGRYAE